MAEHERSALLRVGPRRHKWSELQSYDERLAEIEQRREELTRQIGEKMADRHNEPQRLATAIDLWIVAGAKGDRPQSRVAALDQEIEGLQAEHLAAGLAYERLLAERVPHVERNRRRMVDDIAKEVGAAARAYLELVDQLEETRRALVDWRSVQVWSAIFPHQSLTNEPNTQSLCGALRRLQEEVMPGLRQGINASACFDLLRRDAAVLQIGVDPGAGSRRTGRQHLRADPLRCQVAGRQRAGGRDRPAVARNLGPEQQGAGDGRADRQVSGGAASSGVGRVSPVTSVCSRCLQIRPCRCPRTDGQQRRRRQAANIESRRKTRHWARLRLQRLKLAGGLCELRHHGCTRIARPFISSAVATIRRRRWSGRGRHAVPVMAPRMAASGPRRGAGFFDGAARGSPWQPASDGRNPRFCR